MLTNPTEFSDHENPYWVKPPVAAEIEPRVRVRYVVPPNLPLWFEDNKSLLSGLSISKARGGTVFNVTPVQWSEVVEAAGGWTQNGSGTPRDQGIDPTSGGDINHEERAARVWDVLVEAAGAQETITYGHVVDAVDVYHRALTQPLALIQDFCLSDHHPPLASLVVHAGDAIPGVGFIAWDVDNIAEAHESVFRFDLALLTNPFEYAKGGDTHVDLASRLLASPESAEDIYRQVKVRGQAQVIFRAALLEAYDGACAFCGLSFTETLDAAHIVQWSKCSGADRMSVLNGILLCSNHHEMFDADWIRIDDNYEIVYTDMKLEHGPYSAVDEALSTKLHGQKLRLPKKKSLWPDPAKIRARYSKRE